MRKCITLLNNNEITHVKLNNNMYLYCNFNHFSVVLAFLLNIIKKEIPKATLQKYQPYEISGLYNIDTLRCSSFTRNSFDWKNQKKKRPLTDVNALATLHLR